MRHPHHQTLLLSHSLRTYCQGWVFRTNKCQHAFGGVAIAPHAFICFPLLCITLSNSIYISFYFRWNKASLMHLNHVIQHPPTHWQLHINTFSLSICLLICFLVKFAIYICITFHSVAALCMKQVENTQQNATLILQSKYVVQVHAVKIWKVL